MKKSSMEHIPWKEARKNLLEYVEKYPAAVWNALDSAYLAGLEDAKAEFREKVDNLKIPIDEILPRDSVTVVGQLSRNETLREVIKLIS